MPGGINRIPDGLQSLLGVKALGRNPQAIEDLVRPVIDLTGFYLANKTLEVASAQEIAAAAADTEFATVEVPSGEVWFLVSVACRWGPTGAGPLGTDVVPVLRLPSSPPSTLGVHALSRSAEFTQTLSSAETGTNVVDLSGLVAPPGTQFSSYCNNISSGGSATFNTTVLHVSLQV